MITYVRQYHPAAVFECLWPLDANQGSPAPSPKFRALNFYVNLPNEWKNSSYGIKYFRCEGFDYDVWQKNSALIRQVITFAHRAGPARLGVHVPVWDLRASGSAHARRPTGCGFR